MSITIPAAAPITPAEQAALDANLPTVAAPAPVVEAQIPTPAVNFTPVAVGVKVSPIVSKWLVGLLQVAIVATTAISTSFASGLDSTVLAQLAITILGAVAVVLVPLASGPWAGVFKTSVAVVIAGVTALVPFLTQGDITAQNWFIVGGAALAALATQLGVSIRSDVVKAAAA